MKKVKLLLIITILLLFTGCNKITKCENINNENEQNYLVISTYKIYSKNNLVNKVKAKEITTSKNKKVINYLDDYLNKTYKELDKKYGGYKYKIIKNENKITSKVTINYNKLNMKKYIKDNSEIKKYIKNNKLTLKGTIELYESMGSTCK